MTTSLLAQILSDTPPQNWAILVRAGEPQAEIITGELLDVASLAEIPLDREFGTGEVLSLVPFRQISERGYQHIPDDTPLRCLRITQKQLISPTELFEQLPKATHEIAPLGFDISDAEYANLVEQVISKEIGSGEGANFVIRRDFRAKTEASANQVIPGLLKELLANERGTYWSFAISTPDYAMVGASPERHISVVQGTATMNPISGTYRHPQSGAKPEDFLKFLADTKEVEELFMVVDEELKMMSSVCSSGGHITGPYLKQMSRLTHTEYLLQGTTDLDVREVIKETMWAPTVTGSPMENACRIITKYEVAPRGYYSGVLALFQPEGESAWSLDAPILIRTAHFRGDGSITIPAGATLVRHSDPQSEVAETTSKASAVMAALGLLAQDTATPAPFDLMSSPEVVAALEARNKSLSRFWLDPQNNSKTQEFSGKTALIIDAEDRFTTMIAHQLSHLGFQVRIERWSNEFNLADYDLVVAGPGPGDPSNLAEPRILAMRNYIAERLESDKPLLAVCLSHQIAGLHFGLPLEQLAEPRQGMQLAVPLLENNLRIGFYNTFTVTSGQPNESAPADLVLSADDSGIVYGLAAKNFASTQGHVESVLSADGLSALRLLVSRAFS